MTVSEQSQKKVKFFLVHIKFALSKFPFLWKRTLIKYYYSTEKNPLNRAISTNIQSPSMVDMFAPEWENKMFQ